VTLGVESKSNQLQSSTLGAPLNTQRHPAQEHTNN